MRTTEELLANLEAIEGRVEAEARKLALRAVDAEADVDRLRGVAAEAIELAHNLLMIGQPTRAAHVLIEQTIERLRSELRKASE